MPSSISSRQILRECVGQVSLPLLLSTPQLITHQRLFREDPDLSHILQDAFEVRNLSGQPERYMLMPSGCMTLLFVLGPEPCARVCGALTTMRQLWLAAGATLLCVRLQPGCGHWLLPSGVSVLTDHTAPLEQFLSGAGTLMARLLSCGSFEERTAVLLQLLRGLYNPSWEASPLLSGCFSLIAASRGQSHVSYLALRSGCSERYLNRVFRERVGISTKTMCELAQLQYSLYCILTTQPRSLLQTAVTFGYFDQAHMNRHYRKFLFCTANDMRSATNRTIPAAAIPFLY